MFYVRSQCTFERIRQLLHVKKTFVSGMLANMANLYHCFSDMST